MSDTYQPQREPASTLVDGPAPEYNALETEARIRVLASPRLGPHWNLLFASQWPEAESDPDDHWWWLANATEDEIMEFVQKES